MADTGPRNMRTPPSAPRPIRLAGACMAALALALPAVARPLVYCADAPPEGFDPAMWDSASTGDLASQIFQGLLGFRRGGTELEPLLAEHWTASPDARTFTLTLRRGVRFQATPWFRPTREFDADDVLFTFGRFLHPAAPFNRAFPAAFVYPRDLGLAQEVASLDRLDDHTVRFRLRSPDADFPSMLAMSFAAIQSAEYGAQLLRQGRAPDIDRLPVGTGPYRFVSYRPGEAVRLEANPDYWRRPQKTERLVFAIVPDPNVRVQKLITGECQVAASARDVDLAVLAAHPDIVLRRTPGLNVSFLSYNLRRGPTARREVRVALDIAIDRATLLRALFPHGGAIEAVNPFPPRVAGYDTDLHNEFDPARAKRLLAQAGYAAGFDLDLWVLPLSRPSNPNPMLMAQLLQQDWSRLGLRVHLRTADWAEYLRRTRLGEHDVYMSGWTGDTGDPDDYLVPTLGCAANTDGPRFCNADFDRALEDARSTFDPARRAAAWRRAQEIFHRERPWSPIAHAAVVVPMRRDVQGVVISPSGHVDFEDAWRPGPGIGR